MIGLLGQAHVGLFLTASLAFLLIPGPAVLYIVGRSVAQGRGAGLVSVAGIHAGTLVHVAAAALGVSALLMASATAFEIVKFAGAAYLIWIGLRRLFGAGSEAGDAGLRRASHWGLFRNGFVVNLLNPKVALFFLAFLPQFVVPARGAVAGQMLGLGLLYVALGFVTDGAYALAAGTAGDWLRRSRGWLGFERYVSGTLFIALGLAAAVAGGRQR